MVWLHLKIESPAFASALFAKRARSAQKDREGRPTVDLIDTLSTICSTTQNIAKLRNSTNSAQISSWKVRFENNVTSTISVRRMVCFYSKVNVSSWTNLDPDQKDPACSLGTRSSWLRQLFCLIRNLQGFEKEQRTRS